MKSNKYKMKKKNFLTVVPMVGYIQWLATLKLVSVLQLYQFVPYFTSYYKYKVHMIFFFCTNITHVTNIFLKNKQKTQRNFLQFTYYRRNTKEVYAISISFS